MGLFPRLWELTQLANADSNDTGNDDKAARFMKYTAFGIRALIAGTNFPEAPKV